VSRVVITNIGRLYTSTVDGVLVDASLLMEDERIAWIGRAGQRPPVEPDEIVDVEDALVTPGLIDAHTHPVYAGDRLAEIAMRSAGASYADIAAAGGGIRSTVTATREASREELAWLVEARLMSWLAHGTTTVEAKTGYHLERDGEVAAVRLLAEKGRSARLPRVEVSFLGAHDVGPEHDGHAGSYVDEVVSWCADAADAGARFVDVFCDVGYFDVDQSRRVLEAGMAAGLAPRVHADELALSGGSHLAADLRAVSADHLLFAGEAEARALAGGGVTATLCPVTAMAMRRLPPARLFLDQGVTVALGSDHNPGQSGTTSMSLVVGLAVHVLGLSVDEALGAATAGGAAAVAAPDRGTVAVGRTADLVAWDAEHEGAFAWRLGLPPRWVWKGGRALVTEDSEEGEVEIEVETEARP
jgi:imidazolonepropionase